MVGMTPVPELVAPVMAQVQAVKDALAPWAARQMYLNFAETQRPAAPLWPELAYQRLRRIKAAVDPGNLIRSNHAIEPRAAAHGHGEGALPSARYGSRPPAAGTSH
jgi:FAD/FMN-containing dehydrogenase